MKKISEKDLSLNKQEVSALGGSKGTKDATDICTTVQTTLDSHGPICCYFSKDDETCRTCELSNCINCPGSETCPESDDCTITNDETTCAVSVDNVPGCIIPIPETQHC